MFQCGDGTGRDLRAGQRYVLSELDKVWNDFDVIGINLSAGGGKSLICRTIQRETGGYFVTTTNELLDQYTKDYPAVVALKGRKHYTYSAFRDAVGRVTQGEPGGFTYASYFYGSTVKPCPPKCRVMILDEGQSGIKMWCRENPITYPVRYLGKKQVRNTIELADGLRNYRERILQSILGVKDVLKRIEANTKAENLANVEKLLRDFPNNFFVETLPRRPRQVAKVQLVEIAGGLMDRFKVKEVLGHCDKVVVVGAGITEDLLETYFPDKKTVLVKYVDLPEYPNRRFVYDPADDRKDYRAVSHKVQDYCQDGMNTLVHVTYNLMGDLAPRGSITHDKYNKSLRIAEFKREGGVLVAAGLSEGVDFPGEMCQRVIIPLLPFPYLGDKAIAGRLAKDGGDDWYIDETLKVLEQQLSRGLRGPTDRCEFVILDPLFPMLLKRAKHLPQLFKEVANEI